MKFLRRLEVFNCCGAEQVINWPSTMYPIYDPTEKMEDGRPITYRGSKTVEVVGRDIDEIIKASKPQIFSVLNEDQMDMYWDSLLKPRGFQIFSCFYNHLHSHYIYLIGYNRLQKFASGPNPYLHPEYTVPGKKARSSNKIEETPGRIGTYRDPRSDPGLIEYVYGGDYDGEEDDYYYDDDDDHFLD